MRTARPIAVGVIAVALALLAPLPARLLPSARTVPFSGPGDGHLLGTDSLGNDVLAQLLIHAPATFIVPAVAAVALAVVGTLLGVFLGLASSRARHVVIRLADVLLIIPPAVLTLVIVLGFGASPTSIVAGVVLSGVVIFVRVVSAATVQVSRSGYVEAAAGLGDSKLWIGLRDLLPSLLGIVTAESALRFLAAIQLVAALSFLGFASGLGNSWARAIRDNVVGFSLNPWATLAPGIALVLSLSVIALLLERPLRDVEETL
ncbi:ABC transporter permease [Enemella sp. A6]|uniref:ABC transporter permease n=1 Tax=Enemella sp. A6 TaxID=3440152 RepID=UPI003EC0DFB0